MCTILYIAYYIYGHRPPQDPGKKMPTQKVNAYPESKCLPGEYKHPKSTCWGQEFFFNHAKYDYMPTQKVNACPESTSTRRVHAGARNFFLIIPNKSTCLPVK